MHRPAIVFIHGVRSSSALWGPQLEALRAEGYEAVAVDLPGHGARRDEPFTLDGALAVVDEAVASVGGGTGPVVVAGLSLGGYVTLEHAARHPARLVGAFVSACTCDPHGKPVLLYRDAAHHLVQTLTSLRGTLPTLTGRLRSRAGAGPAGHGPAPVTTQHAGSSVDLDGTTAPFRPGWDVVTDMLGQLAGRSAVRNASQVDVPLWFVNGKRDHMRLEEKKYLAAAPHARLVVVPGAGHDVSSDAPDEYTAVLLGALADLEAGRALARHDAPTRGQTHETGPWAAVPNAAAV